MKGTLKETLGLSLLVAALGASGSARAADRSAMRGTTALRSELARKGFVVQDGLMDFPHVIEMCCQCQLPSCFANNPSSPYGLAILPPAPDQSPSVPNPYSEWFTEDGVYPAGWSWFWRLRPDEAVVFIGTTPPEMKYFGFTAYLYDRFHAGLKKPPDCKAEAIDRPSPPSTYNRFPLFASLGDTVNNMTVHTSGDGRDPFDKSVVFIVASDKNVESRVRHALIKAGYPEATFNTVVVSPQIAHLGGEDDKDTLAFVLRMATDQDLTAYMASPRTLLRVSPAQPVPGVLLDPLPLPKLRVRGTGKTETAFLPAVELLGKAVVAAYPGYDVTPIATTNWNEGYNCIENGQNCLGDNRDTPYIPPSFNPVTAGLNQELTLDPGEFLVAYGVNHAATKKAVYANISVLGWSHKSSPAVLDDREMLGSAAYYLGSTIDAATANMLYAWKFARPGDCSGQDTPYCREIDYTCTGGVAADEAMALVFRAYLEQKTKVGPAYPEIVIDRILKFTPKQQ
jgi:hypothetical protein